MTRPTRENWTPEGKFKPDTTPVEVPLSLQGSDSEAMKIARAVSLEFSKQADNVGAETFEESNDFEIDDDEDIFPTSQFEIQEMAEEFLPDTPLPIEKTPEELALEEAENNGKETLKDKPTEKNEREEDTPTS